MIFFDANENMTKSAIDKSLRMDGIQLEEFSSSYWVISEPHTYIDVSQSIDAAFKSREIKIINFAMLPFSMSQGDHHTFICDISTRLTM